MKPLPKKSNSFYRKKSGEHKDAWVWAWTTMRSMNNQICGECRFWDWYYCDANESDDDGQIIANFGNCNMKSSMYPKKKDEAGCDLFQLEAWRAFPVEWGAGL